MQFKLKEGLNQAETYIFLVIVGSILATFPRSQFDMHHDGLIQYNLRFLRDSWTSEGPWPFNQYGPSWILPYLPSIFFENQIYLMSQITTISIYTFSAYLLWRTANLLVSKRAALYVPLIFVASSSFGTTRTWPSSAGILYTVLIIYLGIRIFENEDKSRKNHLQTFTLGFFTSLLFLTRVQVGLVLFILLVCLLCSRLNKKLLLFFICGFCTSITFIVLILFSRGWLQSSLQDTFLFSLNYLPGDAKFPFPKFTILGSGIVFIITALLVQLKDTMRLRRNSTLILFFSIFLLFEIYSIHFITDSRSDISSERVLGNRLFVSIIIGITLYFIFRELCNYPIVYKIYTLPSSFNTYNPLQLKFLTVTSAASLLQLIPLFDSSHAWWASPPSILLITILVDEVLSKFGIDRIIRFLIPVQALVVALLILLGQILSLVKNDSRKLNEGPIRGSLVSASVGSENAELSNLLSSHLKDRSSILNLCINPNVFLTSGKYLSISRYYVVWPNMMNSSDFQNTMSEIRSEYAITCSELPPVANGKLQESVISDLTALHSRLLRSSMLNPQEVGRFTSQRGVLWILWGES